MNLTVESSQRVRRALIIDWVERFAIAGLFLSLVLARGDALFDPNRRLWFLMYCLSEGLVVLFVLVRRHTALVTMRPLDWFVAVAATILPQFAQPAATTPVPVLLGLLLVVTGVVMQLSAKLILRRSFGLIAANRGVKVSGPYRLVRHPMYSGYLLTHVGLLLMSPLLINLIVYSAALAFQVVRIKAEERLLTQDASYRAYAESVRYRLVPGVF